MDLKKRLKERELQDRQDLERSIKRKAKKRIAQAKKVEEVTKFFAPKVTGAITWKPKVKLRICYEGFVGEKLVFMVRCDILKYSLAVRDKTILTETQYQHGATSYNLEKLFATAEKRLVDNVKAKAQRIAKEAEKLAKEKAGLERTGQK